MKNATKEALQEIAKKCDELEDVLSDAVDYTDADTAEDFIEYVRERIYEREMIYHTNAMEYLKENDPSLLYSMELASDLGYTTDKLNSELLATILMQDEMQEELSGKEVEIEEAFDL